MEKETFFTHDRTFYRTFFRLMAMVALQNLVAYSVNMADNIMLGRYSQSALSGAATVNQIFFLVQQATIAIGDALVIIASQYWGQMRTGPIRKLTGVALKLGLFCGLLVFGICILFPTGVLGIFTSDPAIISEGRAYLNIIQYTFVLFILSHVLMAALRSVEVVKISFIISVVSLIVDVSINYTLIFGKFGFPELGVTGAAIGTLTARFLELAIVVVAMSSASGVMIGKAIGAGDMKRVRSDARSMSVIDICVGIVLGLILLAVRQPLLSMYSLNERAMELAGQFMYILCIVMVGMSYQMPVSSGIIRGAGDARFSLILNLVSVWCIVMPLTFLSAFVWKWPAPAVVCVIQSDQIFKGLPIFLRFRSYKWIKKLTK